MEKISQDLSPAVMWSNKSLQATRDGVSSSAVAEAVIRPACLSLGR
jgi:hypothetical protein